MNDGGLSLTAFPRSIFGDVESVKSSSETPAFSALSGSQVLA
jgi:hypothetical protein